MAALVRKLMFNPPRCGRGTVPRDAFVLRACHPVYARYVAPPRSRCAVLYSHGTAETLIGKVDFVDAMAKRLGVAVLAYEYCGYGCSDGEPNEACVLGAADAALRWLRRRWPADRIVLWGNSLGSGPTCYLAQCSEPLGGLVLESAFLSTYELAKDYAGLLAPLLASLAPLLALFAPIDAFPNRAWLAQAEQVPALVIHGLRDATIPPRHGRSLARQLDAATWYPWAGHDHLDRLPDYWPTLRRWFQALPLR